MKKFLVLFLILLVCSSINSFAQEYGDYNLPKVQRETVRNWIKKFPYYQVAVEKDCDMDSLTDARNEVLGGYYQPYYVEGDFNRDSIEDFALALINTRKNEDRFDVVIFHGKANGKFIPFHHVKGFNLEHSGLVKYGFGNVRLAIASFQSWHEVQFTFSRNRYTTKYQ